MLQIVVEVDGTICDVDCSIFSQTVDRQRPPAAHRQQHLPVTAEYNVGSKHVRTQISP